MAGVTRLHGDIGAATGCDQRFTASGEKSEREPRRGDGDGRPAPPPPLHRTLTFVDSPIPWLEIHENKQILPNHDALSRHPALPRPGVILSNERRPKPPGARRECGAFQHQPRGQTP